MLGSGGTCADPSRTEPLERDGVTPDEDGVLAAATTRGEPAPAAEAWRKDRTVFALPLPDRSSAFVIAICGTTKELEAPDAAEKRPLRANGTFKLPSSVKSGDDTNWEVAAASAKGDVAGDKMRTCFRDLVLPPLDLTTKGPPLAAAAAAASFSASR
jgi:hypothetical protein